MASVASQLIEEVTAHVQSDSLEDAREICAGGIYFPNNLRNTQFIPMAKDKYKSRLSERPTTHCYRNSIQLRKAIHR